MKNLIKYIALFLIFILLSGLVHSQKRNKNKNTIVQNRREKARKTSQNKSLRDSGKGCTHDYQCKSNECINSKCK
jgi:exopolysaccharide biosynthesis protein